MSIPSQAGTASAPPLPPLDDEPEHGRPKLLTVLGEGASCCGGTCQIG